MCGYCSGFSAVLHFGEMLVSLLWAWICSQFDRGKTVKEKEWECVGMVCFSQHISLSTEAGGKPHQSEELRTRKLAPLQQETVMEQLPGPWMQRWQCPVCLPPTCAQAGLSGEERKRFAPHPALTHRTLLCLSCCNHLHMHGCLTHP